MVEDKAIRRTSPRIQKLKPSSNQQQQQQQKLVEEDQQQQQEEIVQEDKAAAAAAAVRRTSSRIQKLKQQSSVVAENKPIPIPNNSTSSKRRKLVLDTPPPPPPPPLTEPAGNRCSQQTVPDTVAPIMTSDNLNTNADDKSASARVIDTVRLFNKHYLHFVQEEEARCKATLDENEAKTKKKNGKTQEKNENDDYLKRVHRRPDLKAVSAMKKTNTILYPNRTHGHIPGVDVGHQFYSRCEMVAIGFHNHWLNGIDYIGQSAGSGRIAGQDSYRGYKLPLAISIVMSGQYEDDLDNCDEVVYTGQGGNNLLGNKRQIKDQVLLRGNLGLKHCMEQSMPVRVTRGHQCQSKNSYVGKVYTYDGLYNVVDYWAEKGVSGFTVYKFRLKRVEGQPPLTTDQVFFIRGRIPSTISELRGLASKDITDGKEEIPIPATNLVDDPAVAPTDFMYCNALEFDANVKLPPVAPGCNCHGTCTDPRTCDCAKLNGSDFPYVERDGGRLIEPKAVVFECGPQCGCGPGCINKTSQRKLNYRLEVFRTPSKGWGVRSWDFIPSGAPVCEYIGVLMKADDIDPTADTNYVFDIDCLQTMNGLDGRERRMGDVCLPMHLQKDDANGAPEFCLDAGSRGNVARFINHSCQPNLFVQCVLSNHHDIKQARVVLFAADNIPPLKELSYDYGYALDSVIGPDGKIKQLACFCGAPDCRKRLY